MSYSQCLKVLFLTGLVTILAGLPGNILSDPPPLDGALMWHTYQGGDFFIDNSHDEANGLAKDDDGNLYVVGTSVTAWDTPNIPTNPHNPMNGLTGTGWHTYQQDVFVAKFNGDGVDDEVDVCLWTPLGEVVDPTEGCSITELCPCDHPFDNGKWKNHGAYVSCVAHKSEDFVEIGLISEVEKDAIVSAAGQSSCGHKKK